MITPHEAQRRAHQLIEEYVAGALCQNGDDVARILSKLITVAGVAIASVRDKDEAVRLMQLSAHMLNQMPASTIPDASYVRPTRPRMDT